MRIQSLFIYPVKSCAGIEVNEMPLVSYGPEHDREFMVVNRAGMFLTQREHPKLCLIRTSLNGNEMNMGIPNHGSFNFPLHRHKANREPERLVTVWKDKCRGIDMGNMVAEALSDFLGEQCYLVRYNTHRPRLRESSALRGGKIHVSFADGYPLLILSEASLTDLNQRLVKPVSMDRFRPNVVISGCMPYAEDQWKEVRIGSLHLRNIRECPRCPITLVDQKTGMTGKEPLRTLEKYRKTPEGKVAFGRYFMHATNGMLRTGDLIQVCE